LLRGIKTNLRGTNTPQVIQLFRELRSADFPKQLVNLVPLLKTPARHWRNVTRALILLACVFLAGFFKSPQKHTSLDFISSCLFSRIFQITSKTREP
jgi:hypothetical protein